MAQYNYVFSPFKIGNIEIKNRIETPPILPCSATPDGFMTREMIEFYRSLARGGAAIITIGDTPVDFEYARGHFGQLNLGDDRVIAGLSTMAEAIHTYGAKISIELNHAGRLASPRILNGKNPIAPSPIPPKMEEIAAMVEGRRKIQITEMNQDLIDQVIDNFASACYRCVEAGFDMVMLHGGHGWLLGQFVSPYSNKRTDAYGGSLENRAKFVVELLTAIRRRVGNRLALEYRVSVDEIVPEGMHEEETIEFLKMIEDKVDLIHASVGVVGDPRCTTRIIRPTYSSHAFNVQRAEKIKKALRTPVTCVGSIMDLATADRIIAEGKADIVAIGRAYMSDPEIINKTIRGELDDIRPCIRCNMCHERVAPPVSLPIRCTVNPVVGREVEYGSIRMAERKKTVLIAGGGPAGMEAAVVASSRGHQVALYEKEKELGGALRFAAGPAFKADMKKYLDWMIMKTRQAPVQVKLSTEATAESIKAAKPDVLIVAVGAEPIIPDIPGTNKPNVAWAGDADLNKARIGETVVLAGAGLTGCETALHLAQQGKKVTVIDMISELEIAKDVASVSRPVLLQLLREHGVEFKTEVKLEEITDKGALVIDRQWNRFEIPADTVVLSTGFTARCETVKAFRGLAPEVYVVGDCSSPRNLMAAIHDAFNVAVEI
ncbi:MAG TPA: FAD-dependent oxidoreductase [Desulfatiglandales bacterium]|nr:FAD-dependent oxidoreductase [Desulfatiglandales bacterium]